LFAIADATPPDTRNSNVFGLLQIAGATVWGHRRPTISLSDQEPPGGARVLVLYDRECSRIQRAYSRARHGKDDTPIPPPRESAGHNDDDRISVRDPVQFGRTRAPTPEGTECPDRGEEFYQAT
jgi:hypothetical protein